MKITFKSAMAGVATLAVAGGGLLGLAAHASAATTTPAWEPDPLAAAPYGNLVFYDASGNVVTGGSNLTRLFDYAAATTAPDSGATKANLIFAAPNHSTPTSNWTVSSASASTSFPNTTAPAPVSTTSNPVVTVGSTDANLSAALGGFVLDTTPGYANIIEVRVKDSGIGVPGSGTHYWESDVAYNTGTTAITVNGLVVQPGTWAQLYPTVQTTTTSISESPVSPQSNPQGATAGQNVTLTGTVTPVESGTMQFFDGTTAIGSPVAVTNGTATQTASAPSFGTHSYTAQFIPTGGTEVQGSTSPASTYVVNPPQTLTSTSLAASNAAPNQYGAETLTATDAAANATHPAGNVAFNATGTGTTTGSTLLGTVPDSNGTAVLSIASLNLPPGTYNLTDTYTPTSSSYAPSTSQAVAITVNKAACPGAPSPDGLTCQDTQNLQVTINPGSLTISTPYTAAKPFVMGAMTLNAAATQLQSLANRFPAATDPQIVVHSSLAGNPNWTATLSGSDLTCASGSCTTPVTGDYQKISAANFGFTGVTSDAPSATFPGTVKTTDIPGPTTPYNPTTGAGQGLENPLPFAASQTGGNGSVNIYGQLSLIAPTATQAGTYAGTLTFTVG